MAIAKDYNLSLEAVNHHRSSGHAGRELTRQVLQAGDSGVLSEFAQISIASKVNRVRSLDDLYNRTMEEIHAKKVGELNPKLIDTAKGLLESAAKEMGEWRPDGGEKAEAIGKLAQSIVIHGAAIAFDSCESRKLEDSAKDGAQVIDITVDTPSE